MIDYKPDGSFGLIIAITVGILIPLMLSMFGWLEKSIRENVSIAPTNGKLENLVKFHVEKYPDLSNREIANVIM